MQAKIDTLRIKEVKDNAEQEYLLYPKTLMRCITDENGNTLANELSDIKSQLGEDIDAHFMTENGFGDLRYYNGKLQYFNESTETWIDTSITPENVYIMQMMPQTMQSISGMYDIDLGRYKLKWKEPEDTIIDGQVVCVVEKVIIKRKLGSAPSNKDDGELVVEVNRPDFGAYKSIYYVDYDCSPTVGDTWYYKAFPVSTTGFVNESTANQTSILCRDYAIYGFRIDQTESDPASMITYIEDNKDFSSAYMDYTSGVFKYGDWEDAWFMNVKPCMLKYDGTVAYELDKNDYTKKIDGTDSDIANVDFEGNAMVGFPKVYYKCVNINDDVAEYYFSSVKLDDDYHCWSHIDNNGNEIDYCYMPIYDGSNVNSVLRSISGQTTIASQTGNIEITYAKANNQTDDIIWYTEVFADVQIVNLLLLLISKSTNTQAVFGNGHCQENVYTLLTTGTLNDKGLFYGTNGTGIAVKVFGMENWWGSAWRRTAGCIYIDDDSICKIKTTYSQSDGSTVDGYNTDGSGYIVLDGCNPSGTNGGYITKMKFTEYGLIPIVVTGSATTYYCDGMWMSNSAKTSYVFTRGSTNLGFRAGALQYLIGKDVSHSGWNFSASISCKPLATTN